MASRYEGLKKTCIDQVSKFFKSNESIANKIIQIIQDNFDNQIEMIFKVTDTIRHSKYSRKNYKISSLCFSHFLVFSFENSKKYQNGVTEILAYANSFNYNHNEFEENYLVKSDTLGYCFKNSKHIKDFELTKEFDITYNLYVSTTKNSFDRNHIHNETSKNNQQRYEEEIYRLKQDNSILQSGYNKYYDLCKTLDGEIIQKNNEIKSLEENYYKLRDDYEQIYDKYLYYKSIVEKQESLSTSTLTRGQNHSQNYHSNYTNQYSNYTNHYSNETNQYGKRARTEDTSQYQNQLTNHVQHYVRSSIYQNPSEKKTNVRDPRLTGLMYQKSSN